MAQQGSKLVKDGVQVIQGTPKEPITRATLFLRLWRTPGPKKTEITRATLSMVRPGRTGYVVKELIPIYLNADLAQLPKQRLAAG